MAGDTFDPQYQIEQIDLGRVLGHPNAGSKPLPILGEEPLP
jgi:hypothetical protein